MANKSVSQLVPTTVRVVDDVIMVVRAGVNYKIKEENLPPMIYTDAVLIPAANVLTLFTTPIIVVPAAPVGKVIIPISGAVEFANGTTNYTTNTKIVVGATSTTGAGQYALSGDIADRSTPNAIYQQSGGSLFPTIAGDSASVYVLSGNPAAGNSDLTVTVWYYLFDLP